MKMNFTVVKDEISPVLEALIKELPNKTHRTTVNSANRLVSRAQAFLGTSYLHSDTTSKLRDSIRAEILDNGQTRVVCGGKEAPYAVFVEEGTETPIVPINAKYLHFWMDGKEYFLKSVRGQEGKHFFRDAAIIENEKYGMDIEMDVINTMEAK